jgi:hypothetical protein
MGKQKEYLNVIEFTEYPGPRYDEQGPESGEKFYVEKLNPTFLKCYREDKELVVNLDGTAGFASSFLDEAFGQLTYDFGVELLDSILHIESADEPEWPRMIREETIPQWQKRREQGAAPHATMNYKVFRMNDKYELIERNSNDAV